MGASRAYNCTRISIASAHGYSCLVVKYLDNVAILVFPRHVDASIRTLGNDRISAFSACTRTGNEPNSVSSARAIRSLIEGTHMSCRIHTFSSSLSRALLLFGITGGAIPDGTPGAGLPPLLQSWRTTIAVSSASMERMTCEFLRISALMQAASRDSYGNAGARKSPSINTNTRAKPLPWSLDVCSAHLRKLWGWV